MPEHVGAPVVGHAARSRADRRVPAVSESGDNRSQRPTSEAFKAFIAVRLGRTSRRPAERGGGRAVRGGPARGRGERFPGERLVLPAGAAEGAQQRHRLPLPAALGVRPPHRPGHRPRARRRAGAAPAQRRRGRPPARRHDAVLYFRPRPSATPRSSTPTRATASCGWACVRAWRRSRPSWPGRRAHRRAGRRPAQGRRGRRRPGAGRARRGRRRSPSRGRGARGHAA